MKIIFLILLYALPVIVLLPSGSVYGVNIKSIAVIVAFISIVCFSLTRFKIDKKSVYIIFWFLLFLLYGGLVAYINSVPLWSVSGQAHAITSAFSVFFILYYISKLGLVDINKISVYLVNVIVAYAFLKGIIEIAIITDLLEGESIYNLFLSIFGSAFIRLDLGWMYRIHLPTDFLLPLVLLYIFIHSRNFKYYYLKSLLLVFAILISYSRLLYFELVLVFFLYLVLIKRSALHITVSMFIMCFLAFFSFDFLGERLSGQSAQSSDMQRFEMLNVILPEIISSPIFGQGMGYYTSNLIRIPQLPWYYELQWLAIIMQFGMFGFLFLLLPIIMFFLKIKPNYETTSWNIMLVVWLLIPIFNGFLLTSISGLVFFAIWAFVNNEQSNNSFILSPAVSSNTRKQ